MIKIYKYIFGYMQLEVVCSNIGRLLSLCAKSGIKLWDIDNIDGITLKLSLPYNRYEDFNAIAKTVGASVKNVKITGFINKIKLLISRKFFVIGFLLFVIFIFLSTSFVTDIYVSGNDTLSSNQIVSMLSDSGFSVGTFVHNINCKEIQQKVLLKEDKLSWLWIHIEGSKAYVHVKETVKKPNISDNFDYSNCVAMCDGVIEEVMPRYGKQIVYPGDVVKKGDLLISGLSETKASGTRYLHADGIVTAKTWYSISGEYNHTKEILTRTGNMQRRYFLNVNGYTMPFGKKNDIKFKYYDTEYKQKKISDILNLSFTICTYYEIIKEDVIIEDNEVVDSAVKVLSNILKIQLFYNNCSNVSFEHSYYINQSGNVIVTVTSRCLQNIAKYMPLEKPQIFTEELYGKNSNVR